MMLYELALELGVRSTVLLDRAQAMGMDVSATGPLTAEQVQELRSAYGVTKPHPQPALDPTQTITENRFGNLGTGPLLALVGAGLVVVILIAYMITSSGSDDGGGGDVAAGGGSDTVEAVSTTTEPCDPSSGIGVGAIGQAPGSTAAPAGDALPPCSVAGGLSDDAIDGTTTTVAGDPIDVPRDKDEFCKAALSAMDFDTKMMEAATAETIGPLRDTILQGRDRWRSDATIMVATGPPRLDVAMDRYVRVYSNLVDSVTPEVDDYTLAVHIITTFRTDLNYYAAQIGDAINTNCDKH